MNTSRLCGAICAWSFVLFACLSSQANAVVVGDKDWLQVSATTPYTGPDFDAIFNRTTGECDVAGCLLGGVLDLTGYIWASTSEVDQLLIDYSGTPGLSSYTSINTVFKTPTALDTLFADFTPTIEFTNLAAIIRGVTRDIYTPNPSCCSWYVEATNYIEGSNDYISLNGVNNADIRTDIGGWVYRPVVVPIPTAAWLFGSGLLGLVGIARRKKTA